MLLKSVLIIFVSVLAWVLASTTARAASVSIAQDRMLVVDGKRAFLLGIYENPKDDGVLKQVADAGFSLVYTSPEPASLDRLQQHGLHAWLNTGPSIDLSEDRVRREEELRKMVAAYAGHPAFLVWEVPDEALWNCWYTPFGWRGGEEPRLQREKIDALTDTALAEQLRARRAEADTLFKRGEFLASEQIADEIWRKLGADSPRPGLNLSECSERSKKLCDGMRDGYALLKQLDTRHPVWMNHAPRNHPDDLKRIAAAADAVGCDIYPIPEFMGGHADILDRSMASVGAYTAIMQESAPSKPVWMVLQGFGWADLDKNPTEEVRKKNRRPTLDESRFMAYDSIVRGARGIFYWGTAYIEKDSQLWTDLLKLIRELADLQPVLSAPDVPVQPEVELAPSWGSGQYGVRVLAKQLDDTSVCYLVVNECHDPLRYTLAKVTAPNGTVYRDPADDRSFEVRDGKLTLSITGRGIQILRPRVS